MRKDRDELEHRTFRELHEYLETGDLLVLNNTRVSAKRLIGKRPTGARVEALLLRPGQEPGQYVALTRPSKRLQPDSWVVFNERLKAVVEKDLGKGQKLLRFDNMPGWQTMLDNHGSTPLPPYIHTVLQDNNRYQTVYAAEDGSSAAPTAGLHFTPEVLTQLKTKGVDIAYVTLDVGIDTFRPVQAESLDNHVMHGETCRVSEQTAQAVEACQGRVIAVGTTTVRTLETFAIEQGRIEPGERVSKLFIRPGFEFKVVDGMLTNFHMPRTSMLFMVSALCGHKKLMNAYAEALSSGYRFLSFGDCMLVI